MGTPLSLSWALSILLCVQCHTEAYPQNQALSYPATRQICHLKDHAEKLVCKGLIGEALFLSYTPSEKETLRHVEFHHGNTPIIRSGTFKELSTVFQLTVHNMSLMILENGAFQGLNKLKMLDLSHNNLREIPPDVFLWTGLKHLRLDGNPYLQVPTNSPLLIAPKLQWLSLRHCGIEHLPGVAFSKNHHLSHLDLSSNRLEQLPEVIFQNTSLKFLDLSNNNFKTLSLAVFMRVPEYPRLPRAVLLAGNRWHCDCRLASLVTWLAEDLDTHYPTTDPARSRLQVQTTCTSPAQVAAVSWNKFQEWNCNV